MRYGSVCSGIEAASCAWHDLGWEPQWFSEIAPFPSSVLRHHFPEVPNRGDFTQIDSATIDLLVGGTPCQDFSVAGLRAGLDGERGNLTLEFVRLAERTRPRWILWENVPGVLSIDHGRAFGSFLGGLGQLGYGFAYRVLDAQFFGVPQRRRRVFVVGHLGDWRRAAAVLFESASLRWDPPPSREAGQDVAGALGASTGGSDADDGEQRRLVAGSLTRGASNGGGWRIGADEAAQGHIVADSLRCRRPGEGGIAGDDTHLVAPQVSPALNTQSGGHHAPDTKAYVVQTAQTITRSWHRSNGASAGSNHGLINPVHHAQGVRRLTPRECERLQGFPDDWTLVPHNGKPAADGPRYEAIGNSMAVPVMRWLGQRIQLVEDL